MGPHWRDRLGYNAPVILTVALLATACTALDALLQGALRGALAIQPGFSLAHAPDYLRLVTYPLVHARLDDFLTALTLFLTAGPLLEEKVGSVRLGLAVLVGVLVGGFVQAVLRQPLDGMFGAALAVILLGSYTKARAGKVPLTFLLVALLVIGGELWRITQGAGFSRLGHWLAALSAAGFAAATAPRPPAPDPLAAALPAVPALPAADHPPAQE